MDVQAAASRARRMILGHMGITGIRKLGIVLRNMDRAGTGRLAEDQVYTGLQECGAPLMEQEVDALFSFVGAGDGTIPITLLMDCVCGALTARRRAVLDQVFAMLDGNALGVVALSSLRNAYRASRHPQVVQGKKSEMDVIAEFEQLFNNETNPSGYVSYTELYEFYSGLSTTIDDDFYFEALVKAVWDLETQHLVATRTPMSATKSIPNRMDPAKTVMTDTGRVYLREYAKFPRPRVFMDISIEGAPPERVIVELLSDFAPKTCENFRALCTGERGVGHQGKPLYYKGLKFHRIVPGFCIQGGDVVFNNGKGGESIYGKFFDDETFELPFSAPGLVAMANWGPNTNSSQFFFAMKAVRFLNDRHTAFGCVVHNLDFLRQVERWGSDNGSPVKEVVIVDCGQLSS